MLNNTNADLIKSALLKLLDTAEGRALATITFSYRESRELCEALGIVPIIDWNTIKLPEPTYLVQPIKKDRWRPADPTSYAEGTEFRSKTCHGSAILRWGKDTRYINGCFYSLKASGGGNYQLNLEDAEVWS